MRYLIQPRYMKFNDQQKEAGAGYLLPMKRVHIPTFIWIHSNEQLRKVPEMS